MHIGRLRSACAHVLGLVGLPRAVAEVLTIVIEGIRKVQGTLAALFPGIAYYCPDGALVLHLRSAEATAEGPAAIALLPHSSLACRARSNGLT